MTSLHILEWLGSLTGIYGALLMARNVPGSGRAYLVWLTSSITLVAFAFSAGLHGLLLQQSVFTAINLLGLYRWVLKPAMEAGRPACLGGVDLSPLLRRWRRLG